MDQLVNYLNRSIIQDKLPTYRRFFQNQYVILKAANYMLMSSVATGMRKKGGKVEKAPRMYISL